jgi:hypothetical protein
MRLPTGRTEKRIARAMSVELSPLDASLPAETTFTVNVSPHGARVLTKQRWHPEERVLLKSVQGGLRLQARVIYCQHLPSKHLRDRAGSFRTHQGVGNADVINSQRAAKKLCGS